MPKREDRILIADILENMKNIFEFTNDCDYDQFVNNKMKMYAVIRYLEIIGEAASLISEELKAANPFVEWREMRNFRNRLIHDYFGIDNEIVWAIIETDIPHNYEMLKQVR